MRYIITENRLNNAIMEYISELYDVSDINWTNPYMYDDETGEEYEDGDIIDFYKGDYEGPYDSDFCFRWYQPEYYHNKGQIKEWRMAPILEVHENEGNTLNSYFGDKWHEPFKRWFQENFEMPVKTIKVGILE